MTKQYKFDESYLSSNLPVLFKRNIVSVQVFDSKVIDRLCILPVSVSRLNVINKGLTTVMIHSMEVDSPFGSIYFGVGLEGKRTCLWILCDNDCYLNKIRWVCRT